MDGKRQDTSGTTCIATNPSPGYHVLELGAVRGPEPHHPPTVKVHYVADRGRARVVGIEH